MIQFKLNGIVYGTGKTDKVFEYESDGMTITLHRTGYGVWFYVRKGKREELARPLDAKYVREILLNRGRADLVEKYGLNLYFQTFGYGWEHT